MVKEEETVLEKIKNQHKSYFRYALFLSIFVAALPVAPIAFMRITFGPVLYSDSVSYLLWLTLILILALALNAILEWIRDRVIMAGTVSFVSKLEEKVFSTVFEDASKDWGTGAKAINNLRTIRTGLISPVAGAVLDAPFSVFWLIVIFFIHPFMGILSIFGAFLTLVVGMIVEKKMESDVMKASEYQTASRSEITSYFQNLDSSLAMGTLPNLYKRWNRTQSNFLINQAKASAKQSFGSAATRIIMMVQGSMLLGLGTLLFLLDILSSSMAGNLIIAKFIGALAIRPMMTVVMSWKQVVAFREAYKEIGLFLENNSEIERQMELPNPKGYLTVNGASVKAEDSDKKILDDINIMVAPSSVTIVLGESGSGKTTLARLLVGFNEPDQGSVRLDGVSMFKWDKSELGPNIGYLPQSIEIFGGTVVENICRFTEPKMESLQIACSHAGLEDVYNDYSNGIDKEIDPDSMTLSGGMKQKIGIARAIYGDPKFIVFDEPTSSLDAESEKLFINSLDYFRKKKSTVIVMTHNKSILKVADHILVLYKGRQKIFDSKKNIAQKMRMSQLENT